MKAAMGLKFEVFPENYLRVTQKFNANNKALQIFSCFVFEILPPNIQISEVIQPIVLPGFSETLPDINNLEILRYA